MSETLVINRGAITTTLTVWCGRCSEWSYLSKYRMKDGMAEARAMGWKLTREWGWVCPNHTHAN